jgi:hypothetical protein
MINLELKALNTSTANRALNQRGLWYYSQLPNGNIKLRGECPDLTRAEFAQFKKKSLS